MSFIVDIDLDYFRLFKAPLRRLDQVLKCAGRPVDFIVDHHHEVVERWETAISEGIIGTPTFILHIDEHHDMLGEQLPMNLGNFMYFVMQKWSHCHVCWLTKEPIDHPAMWLSEEAWESVRARWRSVSRLDSRWPQPDLVSVCTSPGFIEESLSRRLLQRIAEGPGRTTKTRRNGGSDQIACLNTT